MLSGCQFEGMVPVVGGRHIETIYLQCGGNHRRHGVGVVCDQDAFPF
jgi:hypothetical protein